MAADAWELRTARLEGAYEQIDRRLGAVEGRLATVEGRLATVEGRLATLEQKMDTGFAQIRAEVSGVRDASHTQFYWLLGVMLSGFLAIGLKLAGH